ncbi:unnamed protein product [Polarella glacialis]|uniref:Uncharacterized protein n=1 Tax=Polarella glacialis TaxID=89957 RepID=A0A813EZP8_POLGL|nr:unnamed protein product [Polarella glacialis]
MSPPSREGGPPLLPAVPCQVPAIAATRRVGQQVRLAAVAAAAVLTFSGLLSSWSGRGRAADEDVDRRLQDAVPGVTKAERCRPARRPLTYGRIQRLEAETINWCGEIPISDLLGANLEVTTIAYHALTPTAEVLLLVQRRGSVYQLNVVSDGDTARWEILRPPARQFKKNSCLDFEQFCEVSGVTAHSSGFVVVDRHRLQEFNYSWDVSDEPSLLMTLGKMNMAAPAMGTGEMSFPQLVAMYKPLNATYFDTKTEITPFFLDAHGRYFLVADTGNNRILVLNTTSDFQMDLIEIYGTGQATSDIAGFNNPSGISIYAPAYESPWYPVNANVFVCDRFNHRLIKLNFAGQIQNGGAYKPMLAYSGMYFREATGAGFNESLSEPTSVSNYRHWIFVAEAAGNRITVLTVNYEDHNEILFVTHLNPARGIQLVGSHSATMNGFVWATYTELPTTYMVGSFYLPEPLRVAPAPSLIEDFRMLCTNDTFYHDHILPNETPEPLASGTMAACTFCHTRNSGSALLVSTGDSPAGQNILIFRDST